jgi:hypothetical protein
MTTFPTSDSGSEQPRGYTERREVVFAWIAYFARANPDQRPSFAKLARASRVSRSQCIRFLGEYQRLHGLPDGWQLPPRPSSAKPKQAQSDAT